MPRDLLAEQPRQPRDLLADMPTEPVAQEAEQYGYGMDVVLETISAINRGAVQLADLPATLANAVSQVAGAEWRAPMIGDIPAVQAGTVGGFMEPGLGRDIVRAGGELIAPAPPVIAAAKQARRAVAPVEDAAKMALAEESAKLAEDLPMLPSKISPANVPGAKTAGEIVEAAGKGGELQKFVASPQSPEFADKVLRGGKLVADPIAKQAVKQGLDEGLVSMIKTASPETRKRMAGMLEVTKRGRKDLRFADRYRPWDVAGKSMEERIKFVKGVNRDAGKAVNQEAKKLSGQMVDYSPAIDSFLDDLSDMGVMVARGSDGKIKPDFGKSVFRSSPKPKKIVSDIIKHLDTENPVDAREVHIAKKYIDELVNWGKGATGNAGAVENVAKGLRTGLNNVLGDAFPAYRAANQKYSESLNVLEDIAKSSGVKLGVDDAGFNQAVGTGLRRLLSNAQSKSVLSKAADDIETLARKHGADFTDDVRDQVSFANQLDAIFGPSAKTSLAGEEAKVAERVAETMAGTQTVTGMAAEGVKSAYKAARGINEENALKALDALLKTEY